MSNQEVNPNRAATRAPVERSIRLQFDDSMESVEGICENLSIGGMFIRVRETRPQGSLVRFELPMDEGRSIRGLAEVVWMRTTKAGPGREPGVGIKFRFLEQRDRQLIFKVVSEHIKERLAKRPSLLEEEPVAPKVDESMIFRPPEGDEPAPSPPPPPPSSGVRRWPAQSPAGPSFSEMPAVEEEPAAPVQVEEPWQPEPEPAPSVGYESAAEWEPPEPEPFHDESPPPRRRPPLAALIGLVVLTLAATIIFLWPDLIGGGGEGDDSQPIVAEDPGTPALPPPSEEEPPSDESTPGVEGDSPSTTVPPPKPEPVPPPPPPPPPPPASVEEPFDRLEDIVARRVGNATEIVLTTNGSVPRGRYKNSSIGGDNPRELVRLLGMARPFRTTEVPVDDPLVRGIRLGYHKKSSGNEVHVVIDLEGLGVEVTELRAEGRRLVVRLTKR